jgi:hypothetical protein
LFEWIGCKNFIFAFLPFLDKFILSLLVAPMGEERMQQQQQQLLLQVDLSWFFKKAAGA